MIAALAGGVGASRFLQGLVKVVPPEDITVIVNTGDDIELYGLYICPDIDTVIYALAGMVDSEKGWGIRGDTFYCLDILARYGLETWFRIGDRDLATHLYRTSLLREGFKLDKVTEFLCRKLGVRSKILPMTNKRVKTKVATNEGILDFQEYFVKRKYQPEVYDVVFEGIGEATPAPGVIEAISEAEMVIICPSNPIVSIKPILSVRGVMEALRETSAKIAGISPIVGGAPLRGPADRLMRAFGLEPSAYGVAQFYRELLDIFVIDGRDKHLKERIEKDLPIKVVVTNTIMETLEDKVLLAKTTVNAAKT